MTQNGQAVREKIWIQPTGSKSLVIPDSVNVDMLASEFSKGATLILNHLDDYDVTNKLICDAFHDVFNAVTKTVAFITPPAQQGLGAHYDTFEGFIVQTHGTKTWHVYEQVRPLATKPKGFRPGEVPTQKALEATLEPGDCLYVPWGAPHYATTQDTISCHVTVMVFPPSWDQVIREALRKAIPTEAFNEVARLGADPELVLRRLRSVLEQTLAAVRRIEPADLATTLVASQLRREPMHAGFLLRDQQRRSLSLDSQVSRNRSVGLRWNKTDEGRVQLGLAGRWFAFPGSAEPVLEALAQAESLRLKDLADAFAQPGAVLKLADHLLANGALSVG
jgi:hypothetical protein